MMMIRGSEGSEVVYEYLKATARETHCILPNLWSELGIQKRDERERGKGKGEKGKGKRERGKGKRERGKGKREKGKGKGERGKGKACI
ncbi:hypothetical protein KKF55_04585 [Patescibacteria group bacterium]|nr:hypothetical protein [Patescibacteria group bacterium]